MLLARQQSDTVGIAVIRGKASNAELVEWCDLDRFAMGGPSGWFASSSTIQSFSSGSAWTVQEVLKTKTAVVLTTGWKRYVFDPRAPVDFPRISAIFDSVLRLIQTSGPSNLNMENMHPGEVNGELLVSALRASFRWREEIPGWKAAVQVAREALKIANHENIDLCLAGLE